MAPVIAALPACQYLPIVATQLAASTGAHARDGITSAAGSSPVIVHGAAIQYISHGLACKHATEACLPVPRSFDDFTPSKPTPLPPLIADHVPTFATGMPSLPSLRPTARLTFVEQPPLVSPRVHGPTPIAAFSVALSPLSARRDNHPNPDAVLVAVASVVLRERACKPTQHRATTSQLALLLLDPPHPAIY